ncbi:hypothetical protein EDD15DRAFT_2357806 [Pisolithus albus]|nr:hypothetical protein EDD15DRAFT_2380771 [Pisolithus albus]KAI5980883.1 hypothetical protein EDD15DRAFT_2380774 [Pisolithus albus]KAI6006775.1 hypothetical protein EDD15DRAFT_2357806 [Pisolithus albus]
MSFRCDYTSSNVPDEILGMVSLHDSINVDVLSMGAMAGTGLSDHAAEDKGMIKNHWMWRFVVKRPGTLTGQIQFGFNLTETPSVPSDQAQYARSSDRPFDSDSGDPGAFSTRSIGSDEGARFDDVSSINKPPDVLPTSGEHAASDTPSAVDIRSALGGVIQQPSRGPRVPGTFGIFVRPRAEASWSHRFTRSFRLAPGTTFGQLFRSVTSRGMEPFCFQQVGLARFGCRDGISQFAAAWLADGLMVDGICVEKPPTHIYDLLCWRYSRPAIVGEVTTSDEDEAEEGAPRIRGFRSSRSYIDRAIWPEGYVHVEHPKLLFTQRPDA